MHITPDEGESVRPEENSKSSEFRGHKKDGNTDTSEYDRVLNALKKLDTSYNMNILIVHDPFVEGKYKETRDTRVIWIRVEHEGYEIQ